MSETAAKFGLTVREHRIRRGLSQEGLADLARINRGYLGEIERGEAVPSLDVMERLAEALSEKLSRLLEEIER